jgi:hypothetical protein
MIAGAQIADSVLVAAPDKPGHVVAHIVRIGICRKSRTRLAGDWSAGPFRGEGRKSLAP